MKENVDPTKTWVYGKTEPGWYCARTTWDGPWAKELEAKGYQVRRSIESPALSE